MSFFFLGVTDFAQAVQSCDGINWFPGRMTPTPTTDVLIFEN
jgi:hypothetical protein